MFDYDLKRTGYSPTSQLAILFLLCGVGFIIGGFVSIGIAGIYLDVPLKNIPDAIKNPEYVGLSRFLQFLSTFLMFALPALLFAKVVSRRPLKYIGFNRAITGKQVFIIAGIVFMSVLVSNMLEALNTMIPLTESMEKYFKDLEEEYTKQTLVIANMKTAQDYVISLLMIALLPALFEEMLFRGALQPVMIKLTTNAFAGILITSILFSAMHMSFYGFLPRLALGLIIGYIFYLSKNLWLSITAHCLYNAYGVTQMYALSRENKLTADAVAENNFSLAFSVFAFITLFVVFYFFKKESEVVIASYNLGRESTNDYLE
jgi:membrane protease YdiL (CAAX protease family)